MNVDILIVGASLAGWTCAQTLRQDGFPGSILLAGDEPHPPYDRPPLSKGLLAGTVSADSIRLGDALRASELEIALQLGIRAVGCDTESRLVTFADGREVGYGELVIATGVRPRGLPGARTVRTLDDVAQLAAIGSPADIVIGGAGFLGTELAATLTSLGHRVTVVSATERLLTDQLGTDLGELVTGLHRDRGVRVLSGMVTSVVDTEDGHLVRLQSGESVSAQFVIACIGTIPNVDWLSGSGLAVGDGVECDEIGRAGEHEWSVGDVANWAGHRVEHRMSASTGAVRLAGHLLARQSTGPPSTPLTPLPYVWTDQYDAKIQLHGRTGPDCHREIIAGSVDSGKLLVACGRDGKLVGVLGTGMIRTTIAACKLIRSGVDYDVASLREELGG